VNVIAHVRHRADASLQLPESLNPSNCPWLERDCYQDGVRFFRCCPISWCEQGNSQVQQVYSDRQGTGSGSDDRGLLSRALHGHLIATTPQLVSWAA